MTKRPLSPYSEAVSKRFIEAVDSLIERKIVRSKRGFCLSIGMPHSSNLKRIGDHPELYSLSVDQVCKIVYMYKVSPEWLLTGRGEMFE